MRFERGIWDSALHAAVVATERVVDARSDAPDLAAAVEAVDLTSGRLLWAAPCSGQPIATIGRRVVVARWVRGSSSFSLCLLNGENGEILGRHRLPLPSWTDLPGANVTIDARREHDDRLIVTWHGKSDYAGGAPPPPDVLAEQTRDDGGSYIVDPTHGTVHAAPAAATMSPSEKFSAALTGGSRCPSGDDARGPPAGIAYLPGERPVAFTGEILLTLQVEPIAGRAMPPGSTSHFIAAREPATSSVLWRRHIRDVIWRPPPPPQP